MNYRAMGMGLVSLSLMAGCTASSAATEETDVGTQDIVGVTDLAAFEASLGLSLGAPDAAALAGGACYRTLIASPPPYGTFEFRRYQNGAAFWAQKGSGYNSGDQRPVLCVDIHRPNGGVSLSGVSLDAVTRYDLGTLIGTDSGMQKTHVVFQRGVIQLSNYDVTDEERAGSVSKRPHEQPFEHASTIGGRLVSITVKDVTVDELFTGVSVKDLEMQGAMAYFIYRAAWRKSEDTGRFTLGEDIVGAFRREASRGGDGPGYGETWSFARGEVTYSMIGNFMSEGEATADETIHLRAKDAPYDQAPIAECTRTIEGENAPPPYGCTGI